MLHILSSCCTVLSHRTPFFHILHSFTLCCTVFWQPALFSLHPKPFWLQYALINRHTTKFCLHPEHCFHIPLCLFTPSCTCFTEPVLVFFHTVYSTSGTAFPCKAFELKMQRNTTLRCVCWFQKLDHHHMGSLVNCMLPAWIFVPFIFFPSWLEKSH